MAETEGFSMAQVKEVRVSACVDAIHGGLSGPTVAAALKSIERMKGQRSVMEREWDAGRTIVGFNDARNPPTSE